MVFRLNAAVQHQGGQVVSSEDAGAQCQGGQVVSSDVLDAQEPGSQQLATGQPAASTAVSDPVPGIRSGVRVVRGLHLHVWPCFRKQSYAACVGLSSIHGRHHTDVLGTFIFCRVRL